MRNRNLCLAVASLYSTCTFAAVHYVDINSASPVPPYLTWATAATTIQDAVDVSSSGDEVVVTNGVYASGGRAIVGTMTNRVAITNALVVHSVNGPQFTSIQGYQLPGVIYGDGAIRCAYIASNALLHGFTLTGGATHSTGDFSSQRGGGGVWSAGGVVSNCVLSGNAAHASGGGGLFGTFNNCTFISNSVVNFPTNGGGGVAYAQLNNCTLSANQAPNGGGAFWGTLTNCTLTGNSATNGGGAYQAALTNCTLSGNSATNGGGTYGVFVTAVNCTFATNSSPNGGGANLGELIYCTLTGNWSTDFGGGAVGASLSSCLLVGNSATNGGGVYSCGLTNCTLSGNFAINGGGANSATLKNSIIYFNHGGSGIEYSACTLDYCCTTPQPASGSGNIASDPLFVDAANGNFHLKTNSPCINAGNNAYVVSSTDLDGNPRIAAVEVDMGAYEFQGPVAPSILTQPVNQTTYVASNATFTVSAAGTTPLSYQWNQNGTILAGATNTSLTLTNVQISQSGSHYSVTVTNVVGSITSSNAYLTVSNVPPYIVSQPRNQTVIVGSNATFTVFAGGTSPLSYQWSADGVISLGATNSSLTVSNVQLLQSGSYYSVTITNQGGTVTSTNAYLVVVPSPAIVIHYVDPRNLNPSAPYTNWATAATNIQDAVDAASAGDEVLATNGLYATGGRAIYQMMTNRVAVNKPLDVRSVNGPQFTVIQGYQVPGVTNAPSAIRCVYLTNGASLTGFTLTNGASYGGIADSNDYNHQQYGGGVWCESTGVFLTNCVVAGSSAYDSGGGSYLGTFFNCVLSGNSAYGQGGYSGGVPPRGGGGACGAVLNLSVLSNNWSGLLGGGAAAFCTLNNCLLIWNSAVYGGGSVGGTLNNCTVASNTASCTCGGGAYNQGGGSWGDIINNSIVYFNSAPTDPNSSSSTLNYCCTTPQPASGSGNISSDPQFINLAAGNVRLRSNSPCINAGNDAYVVTSTDLDGHPRIRNGFVDMGAYESYPSPSMRIARASQNITLAWPLWASNFVAQEAGGLPANSGAWSNVAATVSQTVNENVVTVPSTNSAKFFRLVLP